MISVMSLVFACGGQNDSGGGGGASPTEAYKRLFGAVKAKDTEAIKKLLTKKSLELGVMQSQRNKKTLEQVYENGFTGTTFAETLPNIRDERVNGEMGAVEVWNSKDSKWEDLPFIREDGGWKLAIGDLFAGSFLSPGEGRDFLEKQAANAVSNTAVVMPNANSNSRSATVANVRPLDPKSNKNTK